MITPSVYPEFLNNRSDDPHISPPKPPPLSTSVLATTTIEQLTKSSRKNLDMNIVTDQGLPEVDITESIKTDPNKNLIRDPIERNIPRLIVNDKILKQAINLPIIPITNLDEKENNETTKNSKENFLNKIKSIESIKTRPSQQVQQKHPIVKIVEDKKSINDDEGIVAIEPIKYDGPFGLTRQGSFVFYIGMTILTLLAAVFLIMTGVFYSQNYPDSSNNTGKIAGMGICGLLFYLGLQLILIGLWHQKYRQENPMKIVKNLSRIHYNSTNHLKTSMEVNKAYDYTPYTSNVTEQMLLQQPGAAIGTGSYDSVVWPSNVRIETQPDSKFLQPIEWSFGPQQQSIVNDTSSTTIDIDISNTNLVEKSKRHQINPFQVQPSVGDFDNLQLNSTVIEQSLPILSKASETTELINFIPQMELTTEKLSTINGDTSAKKYEQMKPLDNNTDISSSLIIDKNHHHDHHHHHRRHHHHHHHHHRHRPHHHHHHHSRHHHHHHHHRSPSVCSQCEYYPHDYHQHHHHHHSVSLPRVITPHLPKIITPSPSKLNTTVYRETGVNTGNETKIMRDSSVTADLQDIPFDKDTRLDQIPVIRRTIIVEPYPAQPSSQIIVKPQSDMTGKIRLSKNQQLNGENETIILPSTTFLPKKKSKKKKKKSTIVNNNIIEDLKLEDINDNNDEKDYFPNLKIKSLRTSPRKTIKNAFYN